MNTVKMKALISLDDIWEHVVTATNKRSKSSCQPFAHQSGIFRGWNHRFSNCDDKIRVIYDILNLCTDTMSGRIGDATCSDADDYNDAIIRCGKNCLMFDVMAYVAQCYGYSTAELYEYVKDVPMEPKVRTYIERHYMGRRYL